MEKISIEEIPLEAINAARDAMAAEYVAKSLALEQSPFLLCLHKRRIRDRIATIGRYLAQLDTWIKEITR